MRFRHNVAIPLAGLAATIALVPLAGTLWYLSPLLLVGIAATVWGWRSGVDVDADGLTVRALLANKRLSWDELTGLTIRGRRVYAVLAGDRTIALPAVTPDDLPALLEAGDQPLQRPDSEPQPPDSQQRPDSEPQPPDSETQDPDQ